MTDADNHSVCTRCHKAFENWLTDYGVSSRRCKRCTQGRHKVLTKPCRLCDSIFKPPKGKDGSKIYCPSCIDSYSHEERLSLVRQKHGLPAKIKHVKHREKVVDKRIYVSVHSLMHEPVEKFTKALADRRVRLVG